MSRASFSLDRSREPHNQNNESQETLRLLSNSISRDPRQPSLFLKRGALYAQQSLLKEAGQDYARAIHLDPTNHLTYFNMFNLKVKAKEYNLAFNQISCCMSLLYMHRGIRNSSIRDLEVSTYLCQNNSKAQIQLASLYYEKKNSDAALDRVSKVEGSLENSLICKIRAVLYSDQQQTEKYKKIMLRAKETEGSSQHLPVPVVLEASKKLSQEWLAKNSKDVLKDRYRQYQRLCLELGFSPFQDESAAQSRYSVEESRREQESTSLLVSRALNLKYELTVTTLSSLPPPSSKKDLSALYPANKGQKIELRLLRADILNDKQLFGNMDPYCKIFYSANSFQSKVNEGGGKKPVWNQSFATELSHKPSEVKVEIFDKESFKSDDFVGAGQGAITFEGQLAVTIYADAKLAGKVFFSIKRI